MKPLIKPKSKFKEKLKSFFHVDIEKDLQEEEPTKVFEKIPLINLTINKIFLGIFLFLVIVNILVGFNIDFLYIRAILGFLFLVTVPGLLIMLCFKIRTVKFWEFLVYTIGLSIAFIMFAGLIVNWTLPALGITDKPLSLYPILICFDIFLVALGIVGWKRNKDFQPFQFTVPKLDAFNNIFFIIPMAFPVLSVLGASLLNNHGSNILTMIMLGGIAVYVLLLTIFRKKMNENIWPWALWMIGLSLLFSGWMRSWFVSGPDISLEYFVFQLTKENAFWSISNFNNTYNAILSLTILPKIFSNFISVSNSFIFKLFIPFVFSIIPLIVYLISKKILPPISCFFAGILFISLPDFINWYSIPIRQEIAFIFFGLMFLVLFSKEINSLLKKLLFLIFGASMMVSHYSTSYIALALFTSTYIITLSYKKSGNKKMKKEKLLSPSKKEFFLTGVLILLLFLFGFLWYNQITPTADGLINFAEKSIANLNNIFSEDARQGGATDPLFGFFNKPRTTNLIESYKNQSLKYDLSNKPNGFPKETYTPYQINYLPSNSIPSGFEWVNLFTITYYLKQIIGKIFQLFILFGLFYVIKNKTTELNMKIIFLAAGLIVFLFLFLPLFSINYGLTRFLQQILIFLSPISILGGKIFFEKIKVNSLLGLSFLLILCLLVFSGFIPQIIGGDVAKTQLNNFGGDYDVNYMFYSDFFGAGWLNENHIISNVYADASAGLKLNSYGGDLNLYNVNQHLLPNTIDRKSYVYLSTINVIKHMGFFSIDGLKISYNFPSDFLFRNKNIIYNNGGSNIFR